MIINVTDRISRKASIDALKNATKKTTSIMYKERMEQLPVIRIPIDLPIYRMSNGRTTVEQIVYIQENNKLLDFFVTGQENESVQRIQHNILLNLSKDPKGPIYQELELVHIQTESIIITSTGVVVNGNRRLAAMRDIYLLNPSENPEFCYVDCAVLPEDAVENDLEMLETELQLAPETKLEYGWIERRLKLRYQLDVLKIPRDKIKKTYRFTRDEEINVELQQLALAEEYLEKYLGTQFAYKEIGKSEQVFKEMQKTLSGKSGGDAEIRRLTGFLLVKEARNLGDRAYSYRDLYGKEFEKVMQRFAEEEGIAIDTEQPVADDDFDDDDDPLNDLDFETPSPYEPLKGILTNQPNTQETAEKLVSIFESIKQGYNEDKLKKIALKKVQDALRLLNDIDISTSDPETHNQIEGQLNAIIVKSNVLLNQLKKDS